MDTICEFMSYVSKEAKKKGVEFRISEVKLATPKVAKDENEVAAVNVPVVKTKPEPERTSWITVAVASKMKSVSLSTVYGRIAKDEIS